jgi:hypothetical protein
MLMLLVMIRNLLNLSYFNSSCDNVVNIKKLNVNTTISQWQRVLFYETRILQLIVYRIPRYISDTDTCWIRLRYVSMEYPEKNKCR